MHDTLQLETEYTAKNTIHTKFKMGNRMQPTGTVRMVPRRIIYRIRLIHLKPGGKTCQEKRFFELIFRTMIIQLHS